MNKIHLNLTVRFPLVTPDLVVGTPVEPLHSLPSFDLVAVEAALSCDQYWAGVTPHALHLLPVLLELPVPGLLVPLALLENMCRVRRKPVCCICDNKGADKLHSNPAAEQSLCFRYIDSTIPTPFKSKLLSF